MEGLYAAPHAKAAITRASSKQTNFSKASRGVPARGPKESCLRYVGGNMISQTAEYALRAVVFLANQQGTPVNRRELAEAIQVPSDYLTKVLQDLDRAGLVSAQRGPGGGYCLEAPPDELSIYDVVTVVSSLPRIESCPLRLKEHPHLCPLHRKLDDAAKQMEEAFRTTMIEELVSSQRSEKDCRFPSADA